MSNYFNPSVTRTLALYKNCTTMGCMEFFEGFFRRFKKQERVQPKPERQIVAKEAVNFWSYSYFREYLLGISRNKNFVLSVE